MIPPDCLAPWMGTEQVACGWCGEMIPLATFNQHTKACERAAKQGQRSLFGGPRGLFDDLEPSDGR